MTRPERERHIERYLSGQMTPAEEQDFFIQAALDRETRYELKALVTVDSAIRKEREAETGQHTALRARVASMLAAAPAPEQPAPSLAGPAATPTTLAPFEKFFSMKWFGLAAVTLAILAIFFLFVDPFNTGRFKQIVPSGTQDSHLNRERQMPPAAPEGSTANEPVPSGPTPGGTDVLPKNSRPQEIAPDNSSISRSPAAPVREERESNTRLRSTSSSSSQDARSSAVRRENGAADRNASGMQTADDTDEREDGSIAPPKRNGDSLSVGIQIKIKDK